jgi:hypothetical protein
MMRNETYKDGLCISAQVIDLDAGTMTIEDHGQVVDVRPLTDDERRMYGPQPLEPTGALATLLAVEQVVAVVDAANAVGLSPDDLVAEAEAWAAAVEFSGVDE